MSKRTIAIVASFLVTISSFPPSTSATSAITYSFSPQSAANYTTTGPITLNTSSAQAVWYNDAWKYRQKITIHKDFIGEELTDFPVVIRLNNTIPDAIRDDGWDLLVTSSDGTTKLAYEREDRNTLWVKVPTLTPTEDTTLYVYYGNPTVSQDQSDPTNVWTNGYAAVWHMNNNPEGPVTDSTTNTNAGTGMGGMAKDSVQEGKMSKALNFNGSSNYVDVGNSDSLNVTGEITVSAFIKTSGTSDQAAVSKDGGRHSAGYNLFLDPSGRVYFDSRTTAGGYTYSGYSSTSVNNNQWHYLVGRRDANNNISIAIDGATEATAPGPVGTYASGVSMKLGIYSPTLSYPYTGTIDEVHIASVARSSGWIKTEYANQSNTEDFLTLADAEARTTAASNEPATITLNAAKALSFTTLHSFIANGSGDLTFQLSNNAGKTWYFYTKNGWKPANSLRHSSAQDIGKHLSTFPTGTDKLLWKAYLPSPATLDSVTLTYTSDTSSNNVASPSIFPGIIPQLNTVFGQAYNRLPTFPEWKYWADRLLKREKKTVTELLGAMFFQKARSK